MQELDQVGPRWSEAAERLAELARADVADGGPPRPTMAAFAGDRPVALITLRDVDDPLSRVLLEAMALVVPLGADRLAVSLDPASPPPGGTVGPGAPVLAILLVDGVEHPATVSAELADLGTTKPGQGRVRVPADRLGPAAGLATILDRRDLLDQPSPTTLFTQLGRLLVLGHRVALAPTTADCLHALARADEGERA